MEGPQHPAAALHHGSIPEISTYPRDADHSIEGNVNLVDLPPVAHHNDIGRHNGGANFSPVIDHHDAQCESHPGRGESHRPLGIQPYQVKIHLVPVFG
jgi:hypothetical protein